MEIFDIACMGGSTTAGFGVGTTYVPGGWQPHLERALAPGKASRIRVYSFGKGGAGSVIGHNDQLPFVLKVRPRVVLMEYMINDALGPNHASGAGQTLEDSWDTHVAIIQAIKAASPETLIYLQTLNPVMPWTEPDDRKRPNLAQYNALYPELADDQDVGFIDNFPLYAEVTQTDVPDGVHPIEACQKAILVPALVSALSPLIT